MRNLPDGVEYKEARRSLSECYDVYTQQGFDGLRALYSKSHCFGLLRKFESEGWTATRTAPDDIVSGQDLKEADTTGSVGKQTRHHI